MAGRELRDVEVAQAVDQPVMDVNLNRRRLYQGQMIINRYEVESLYELYLKICSQSRFQKSRIQELELSAGKLLDELEIERRKNVEKDQQIALLTCKVDQLKSQLELEQLKARYEHSESSMQANRIDQGFLDIKDQNSEMKAKIEEMQAALQTVHNRLEETMPAERETQLQRKLNHLEAHNDMLMLNKKGQEETIKKLKDKLSTLAESPKDGIEMVTVKKCGRFEIKERPLECSRCHKAFNSKDEMNSSPCYYHPCSPIREVTEDGVKYIWRCCKPQASCKKMLPGCTPGKHCISNKRARCEE